MCKSRGFYGIVGAMEKQGQELIEEARSLGVSLLERATANGVESEPLLQERVRAAKNLRIAHRMFIFAIISAIASAISALAAWAAIVK